MDLLGRKSRKRFETERQYSMLIEGKLRLAMELLSEKDVQLAELARSLYSRDSLVNDLFVDIEILKQQLELLATAAPKPVPSPKPIHMSEEEQELAFQLANKMIDKQEHE